MGKQIIDLVEKILLLLATILAKKRFLKKTQMSQKQHIKKESHRIGSEKANVMVKQFDIEEWHALKKIEKRYRRKNGLLS